MPLIENAFSGIVITAQAFNPSIFTETWLTQNKIIAPDAFTGLRMFSPELAQFQTSGLQVLVTPPKMQITFGIHNIESDFNAPKNVAIKTIELLPHTPYQALGLNFDYLINQPSNLTFSTYNRALLGEGNYRLLQEFSSDDSRFGRYFSKDYGEARLRVDIKPIRLDSENKVVLLFSFNFNYDLVQTDLSERSRELVSLVSGWDKYREHSKQLLEIGSNL